jgi:hypothetical protein
MCDQFCPIHRCKSTNFFSNTTLSEQFLNAIKKNVERGKLNTRRTQIHDSSFSWISTDTSIISGGVKLEMLFLDTFHARSDILIQYSGI